MRDRTILPYGSDHLIPVDGDTISTIVVDDNIGGQYHLEYKRGISKMVEDSIKNILIKYTLPNMDDLMYISPGIFTIIDAPVPQFNRIKGTHKDVMQYLKDFSVYYKSRLTFYDYMFNDIANRIYKSESTIEDSEYTIKYSTESYGVDVIGSSVSLDTLKIDTIDLSDYFFIPKPDFVYDNIVCYKYPPHMTDEYEAVQVFMYDGSIQPTGDDIINFEMDESLEDEIKYIMFGLNPTHPVIINGEIYKAFKYDKTKTTYIKSQMDNGLFFKDIDITRRMDINAYGSGWIEADMLLEDQTIPIPIGNVITEKPINVQELGGLFILYFSYPIVKYIDSTVEGFLPIDYCDNVMIVDSYDLTAYYKYVPALYRKNSIHSEFGHTGSYTAYTVDGDGINLTWTDDDDKEYIRYELNKIPRYFSLENIIKLPGSGVYDQYIEDIFEYTYTSSEYIVDLHNINSSYDPELYSCFPYSVSFVIATGGAIAWPIVFIKPNLYELQEHNVLNDPIDNNGLISRYVEGSKLNDDMSDPKWPGFPFSWIGIGEKVHTSIKELFSGFKYFDDTFDDIYNEGIPFVYHRPEREVTVTSGGITRTYVYPELDISMPHAPYKWMMYINYRVYPKTAKLRFRLMRINDVDPHLYFGNITNITNDHRNISVPLYNIKAEIPDITVSYEDTIGRDLS